LVAATKKLFVVPYFVAVTKPFFSVSLFDQFGQTIWGEYYRDKRLDNKEKLIWPDRIGFPPMAVFFDSKNEKLVLITLDFQFAFIK